MNKNDFTSIVDLAMIRNNHPRSKVKEMTDAAIRHGFSSVITLPCYTKFVATQLEGTDVKTGSVIGFPFGGELCETKIYEANRNIENGAEEIDMVINLGLLASGEYNAVEDEVRAIKDAIGAVPLKCIIESATLADDILKKTIALLVRSGADYVKTATGLQQTATLEQVELITKLADGKIKVKVAGGIRDKAMVEALLKMGVSRLGVGYASAMNILKSIQ